MAGGRSYKVKWYFLIDKEHLEEAVVGCGVNGVLDMLRYDGAIVEGNEPPGFWLLSTFGHPPEVRRWNSFGIKLAAVEETEYQIRLTATRLYDEKQVRKAGQP